MGLEVHAQLLTRTKLFCDCANRFGAPPNTLVCPVCLGLPGALPVLNAHAVALAARAALALGCEVRGTSEGAVSLEGTVAGFLGALAVGATGVLSGLLTGPAALLAGVAGLLGSLAESVLGTVAERRGWMDNHLLNAANTAMGALLVVLIVSLLAAARPLPR